MELIATCAFGLERLLREEIKQLGFWIEKTEDGRITFRGEKEDLAIANIWIRTAERIHIKIAEFPAKTFDELFDKTYELNWQEILPAECAFPVLCSTNRSKLHNEPAIQKIVKKSIVKKIQTINSSQLDLIEKSPLYAITARLKNDICTLSLDSTGASLHKRGYRAQSGLAPIKETLAASLVKLSNWDTTQPLIDPFCGSGTILIEGAMIAQKIAPGSMRKFTFEDWPEYKTMDLNEIRTKIPAQNLSNKDNFNEQKHINNTKRQIFGYDIDPNAISIARKNAKLAGVEKYINFEICDFQLLDFTKMNNATIITNPPYGKRLYNETQTNSVYNNQHEEIYKQLGNKFQQTTNCSLNLLTSDESFEQYFGQKATKNRKLFNGQIQCRLYQYIRNKTEGVSDENY